MEINEDNFKTLAQYLQQTLNPDPNVRRPGKKKFLYIVLMSHCAINNPNICYCFSRTFFGKC